MAKNKWQICAEEITINQHDLAPGYRPDGSLVYGCAASQRQELIGGMGLELSLGIEHKPPQRSFLAHQWLLALLVLFFP